MGWARTGDWKRGVTTVGETQERMKPQKKRKECFKKKGMFKSAGRIWKIDQPDFTQVPWNWKLSAFICLPKPSIVYSCSIWVSAHSFVYHSSSWNDFPPFLLPIQCRISYDDQVSSPCFAAQLSLCCSIKPALLCVPAVPTGGLPYLWLSIRYIV